FGVINEFTGYLQPGNYEIFRDSAAAHGVLDQNKEFAFASGKFQVECYKEECEANLRTPGLSGYQLLDLHDYLGQGTALIGVVDAFWRPKGYVTAAEFHRFSGPVVPLARLYSRVFKTTDKFGVDVEIANFGADAMAGAQLGWKIIEQDGTVAAQGNLNKRDIPIGKNIPLGKVSVDLSTLAAPREYKLDVSLAGTDIGNDWNFWLYPAVVNAAPSPDVLVTTNWSDALARLKQGSKVLFTPPPSSLGNNSPPLDNVPVFWNRLMNPKVGAMMGLLCDAKSAALAGFPTDVYCDWQWTEIVKNMKAINIDKAPAELRPIVQAIDDWNRNYRLGVVFECNVDSGRLVVCAADIQSELDKRLVARQLRRSLLDYMASDKFKPTVTLSEAQASGLFPGASPIPARESAPQALPGDINENPTHPTTTP
ncbi:MAG: beta-galactosidase, partial [Tepidisphaeraceae bacterium]